MQKHSAFFSVFSVTLWLICIAFALQFQRFPPVQPLLHCQYWHAADTREPIAALSGISRANRRTIVLIQRLTLLVPPAISAEVLQNLQQPSHKITTAQSSQIHIV